jgi:hypothetical protein
VAISLQDWRHALDAHLPGQLPRPWQLSFCGRWRTANPGSGNILCKSHSGSVLYSCCLVSLLRQLQSPCIAVSNSSDIRRSGR